MSFAVIAVTDEGFGHTAHLLAVDGDAVVIDPLRRIERYQAAAEQHGLSLRLAVDTHTHADYLSGLPAFAEAGIPVAAPSAHSTSAPARLIEPGAEFDVNGLTVRALPTPGHTDDHQSFLVLDGDRTLAVFTGGSLMVGTVGRPDLAGPHNTPRLARAMFHSLHDQLLVLPDDLPVYPTHGPGSFCAAPGSGERSTTIGAEKAANPLLQTRDEDTFAELLIGSLGTVPGHYRWLPDLNHIAPLPPRRHSFEPLAAAAVIARSGGGDLTLVDVRPVRTAAAGFPTGAVVDPLRPVAGTWLAWLTGTDHTLAFLTEATTDETELLRQLEIVGLDRIAGKVSGGIDAWREAGGPVSTVALVDAAAITGAVLDVRQDNEFTAGHLPGARHVELAALDPATVDPTEPVTVMCGHGERALTAAATLAAAGHRQVTVAVGGPTDWATGRGDRTLETGAP